MREIMTRMAHTMINPLSTICQQGPETREESSHFHEICEK
jgi:hypothetical protein